MKELELNNKIDNEEDYSFNWHGKKQSIEESVSITDKILLPCKEESKNWDTTKNLYIEGDNLEALKLLKKDYLKKINIIYIDPPYNTGKNFVYKDNFSDKNKKLQHQITSREQAHCNWCSMIYPRLKLAKELLSEDGVIFISIDDNEIANLRKICDEVFGESSFVNTIIWQRHTGGGLTKGIITGHDYVLVYRMNKNTMLYAKKDIKKEKIKLINNEPYYFDAHPIKKEFGNKRIESGLERYMVFEELTEDEQKKYQTEYYEIKEYKNTGKHIIYPYRKADVKKIYSITGCESGAGIEDMISLNFTKDCFSFPKPVELVKKLLFSNNDKDSIILDFFSGSGTTAHAVMKLNSEDRGNRKFIMVQLPENCSTSTEAFKNGFKDICEIGKERIRRAGDKIKKESGLNAIELDDGFRVYKVK